MNKSIQKYFLDNISTITKFLIVYLVGIVLGIVIFNLTGVKQEYVQIIKNILETVKQDNFEGINIIANGLKNNAIFILMLYSSLLTIIAPIILTVFLIIKAAATGIYMCTLFSIFGAFKGILVVSSAVVLPFLICTLGYIIICTGIINLAAKIREKIDFREIVKQGYWLLISFSLISFSIVIEQLMSEVMFNIYVNM